MSTTRHRLRIRADRARVYEALLDADAIAKWRVPAGMTSVVHAFDPRAGGAFRVSLTYDGDGHGDGVGKTTARTDTYGGTFVELVDGRRIVEAIAFETPDPAMQGEMRVTTTLVDVDGGTELTAVHEGLPPGVAPADNEAGWASSLARLADLLEPPTKLRGLLQAWRDGRATPPVAALVGFRLTSFAYGEATCALDVEPRHHNPMGALHGGVFVDVADGAMGAAVATVLDDGQTFATVDLHAQYLRAVRGGRVTATARVVHRARQIVAVACDVHDGDGALVARVSSTCAIADGPR